MSLNEGLKVFRGAWKLNQTGMEEQSFKNIKISHFYIYICSNIHMSAKAGKNSPLTFVPAMKCVVVKDRPLHLNCNSGQLLLLLGTFLLFYNV